MKMQSGGLRAGQHPPASPGNIVSPSSSSPILCWWVLERYPNRGHAWGSGQVQLVGFLLSSLPPFFHAEELEGARASSGALQGAVRLWGKIWEGTCLFWGLQGSPSTAMCTPGAFQAKSPPAYCMSPAGAWRRHFSLCSSQALE